MGTSVEGRPLMAVDKVDVITTARRVELNRPEDVFLVGSTAFHHEPERLVTRG
jgi:adenylyl- and sulfurtransferase ThiI